MSAGLSLSLFSSLRLSGTITLDVNTMEQANSTLANLALHIEFIHNTCNTVEEKNLTFVSNRMESSSRHNNHQLVKAAVLFVRLRLDEFNESCDNDNFIEIFIAYLQEKAGDFESSHYDPDGVGGGTITDIINTLKNSQ